MPKPWENNSGCKDPTAYTATKSISEEEQRVSELIVIFRAIAKLAGFEITNRIEFRNRRTGRMYR